MTLKCPSQIKVTLKCPKKIRQPKQWRQPKKVRHPPKYIGLINQWEIRERETEEEGSMQSSRVWTEQPYRLCQAELFLGVRLLVLEELYHETATHPGTNY